MLSERDSIVQVIKNALFMVPGNDPLHPDRGVNILQYLYKTEDQVDSAVIRQAIIDCCMNDTINTQLVSLRATVTIVDKINTLLLAIEVVLSDKTPDQLMIVIQNKNNIVHFNHKYFSQMAKLAD